MERLEFELQEGEVWWGGSSTFAMQQPYDKNTVVSLGLQTPVARTQYFNQSAPLYLSSRGRYIWSDSPIEITFENGRVVAIGKNIRLVEAGN